MATQFTIAIAPLRWSNNLPDTVLEAGVQNNPTNGKTSNKVSTNGNTDTKGTQHFKPYRDKDRFMACHIETDSFSPIDPEQ